MIQDMQMIFVYIIMELKYGNATWRYMVYGKYGKINSLGVNIDGLYNLLVLIFGVNNYYDEVFHVPTG